MYVRRLGGGVKLPPHPKISLIHVRRLVLCMIVTQHVYFRKIFTLPKMSWWRHDDVIIFAPRWPKIPKNRTTTAEVIIFQPIMVESWVTPHLKANTMVYLGKTVNNCLTIRHFWLRQHVLAAFGPKIGKFRMTSQNDVIKSDFQKKIRKCSS